MKWISSTDLISWANTRHCQETLPYLIRKLVRATSNSIQSIKFPSGESILFGGWDGILKVTEETDYLPSGISLWEFGANKNTKAKADGDYDKRTANPLGFNPKESTFIFVTPRLWKNGNDWSNEKKKDGIWKEVRVINAEILEEWIELAPTVGAWLAKKENIGNYPSEGIQSTDDFWEQWTAGIKFQLIPELLLGGRNQEQDKIIEQYKIPSIIPVQGISREESLAFIISCFINKSDIEEDFFSRSIIVYNSEVFKELSSHSNSLILIPMFEDNGVINRAIQKGHIVIVPLGADTSSNWSDKIILPQIEREAFVSSLTQMGMSKEFAEKYSKESARNITILRRQLEFARALPTWASPENVIDIIPALIVGRWDENYEQDKNIVSKIAGDSYENYSKKLIKWLQTNDAPIVKIGSTWRLTSPFDAWANASKNLSPVDFELLYKTSIEILSEINPALQLLPGQRHMASMYGKKPEFSPWIREGIIQSLILTSIFGERLQMNLPFNAEIWVDKIISEILDTEDHLLWKSFQSLLPLIAEASPSSFLDAVEKYISIEASPIKSLFEEDPGFITPKSYHTGLLWALESLAWLPKYLSRASLILAKLSVIDPGGRLSNRPINSLSEIFKSWHYQTLAPFEERMQVLKLISEREKEVAWKILVNMLPDSQGGVANPTNKTRWRMFDIETEKPIFYEETYRTYSTVVDILLSIFDFTESKFATLLKESENLLPHDREKVLSFLQSCIPKIVQIEYTAWHTARKMLSRHRSYPDTDWALPESELANIEIFYKKLMPTDEVENTSWMFNDNWPEFVEGYNYKEVSHDAQENLIQQKRIKALILIYQKFGLGEIIQLGDKVKQPWQLGDTLGHIVNNENEIIELCKLLFNDKIDLRFIESFIFRKSIINGLEWVLTLFENLKAIGFDNPTLAKLLIPLNQTQELWDFIESLDDEISSTYWKNINPFFYRITTNEKIYGLKKLIYYKRFLSATHTCSHFAEDIPSEIIILTLEKTGSEKAEENVHLQHHDVTRLFDTLDKRDDIDSNILIKLEWLFLPILASYGNQRKPKRLHEELSRNPIFFCDVLKHLYLKNEDIVEVPHNNKAIQIYELLHSWKKIPGVDEAGIIDYDFLTLWVKKLRELAIEIGQLDAADIHIGQVLAQYPETQDKIWPPNEICDLIEKLNSDCLNRNFSSATFNKRGFSSRSPFAGGDIERAKSNYFNKLASAHRNKYPVITKIFENLAKGYDQDAKRIDEEAERDRLEY